MNRLVRIVALFGIVIGVVLGLAAVNAYQAVVVTAQANTTVANPACGYPVVGFFCSIGLVPGSTTISATSTVSITGLGLIVLQGILFGLVFIGLGGFFLFLFFRRAELAKTWAILILFTIVAFLAAFGWFDVWYAWQAYALIVTVLHVLCPTCTSPSIWDFIAPWFALALVATLGLVLLLRYVWHSPSGSGGVADGR